MERVNKYKDIGVITSDIDKTRENYFELFRAIVQGNYSLTGLFDEVESEKRMKELDEIYARGELPPLAIEYKSGSDEVKKRGNDIGRGKAKPIAIYDLELKKEFIFKSKTCSARWLASQTNLTDRRAIDLINRCIANNEILRNRYKIKEVLNESNKEN